MTTTTLNDVLQVTRDARGVVTLTLNDPARFNALGGEMLSALQQALDDVARDDTARVVVLAGSGKAFCAGHNLKDMAANPDLARAQASAPVTLVADGNECSFQFNPTGTVKFTSSCDIAKQKLAGASVKIGRAHV